MRFACSSGRRRKMGEKSQCADNDDDAQRNCGKTARQRRDRGRVGAIGVSGMKDQDVAVAEAGARAF